MPTRFRLYSTDVQASLDPDSLSVLPTILVRWDHDPVKSGEFSVEPPASRGSVIRTGGGVVYHDLGFVEGDGTISIQGSVEDGTFLLKSTITQLEQLSILPNLMLFFTDGFSCWKVRFQRGTVAFKYWRNQLWLEAGVENYSYQLNFWIVETIIK